jgi:hypothetical protein
MAIINKTGITNGGTVQAEHVTRAIDALSGVSTDSIIATGSFSGSLTGTATSASFATTASVVLRLRPSGSFTYHGEGTMYAGDFVTTDGPNVGQVRAIVILINGEEYTIYATQTS